MGGHPPAAPPGARRWGRGGGAPGPGVATLPLAAAADRSWPFFPPTSGQSWAAWASPAADADLPDGRRLDGPVVVGLTDYDGALRSTVYHSLLDVLPADARPLAEQVALAARGVVRALVALALADDPPGAPPPGGVAPPPPADPTTLRHALAPATVVAANAAAAAVDEATILQLLCCWALPWAPSSSPAALTPSPAAATSAAAAAEQAAAAAAATDGGGCALAAELLGDRVAAVLAPAVRASNWAGPHAPVAAAAAASPSRAAKTRLARAFLARATAAAGAGAAPRRCASGDDRACAPVGGVCVSGACVVGAVHLHEAYGPGIAPVSAAAAAAAGAPASELSAPAARAAALLPAAAGAMAAAAAAASAPYTVVDPSSGAAAWAVAPTAGLTVCGASQDGSSLHVAVLTVGVGVAVSSVLAAAGVRYGLMVAAMAERQARWRRVRGGGTHAGGWVPPPTAAARTE